ncbi:MAG: hypothetical protein Q9179_007616, partial [Wetmoreana sp. 5 TL-2023]
MQEWLDTARERNLKTATIYKKAINSLRSCPLTLAHPSEAQALNGFGPKICEGLEKRLKQHCEENGLPMPKRRSRKRASDALEEAALDMTPAKKPRKSTKPYVPQLRSGPYALILGLASIKDDEQVTKQQLIELAQPHCDASFTATRDTTSFYSAWSSMKTLVNKDLVKETSRPQRRYALTDEGWEIAENIKKARTGDDGGPGIGQKQRPMVPSFRAPALGIGNDDTTNTTGLVPGSRRSLERTPLVDRSNQIVVQTLNSSGKRLGGTVADRFGTLTSSQERKKSGTDARAPSLPTRKSGSVGVNIEDDAALAARLQEEEDNRARAADHDVDFVELLSSPPPEPRRPARPDRHVVPQTFNQPSVPRTSESPQREGPGIGLAHATFIPPTFQPIRLQPGTFTIELILDNREIRSRDDRSYIEKALISQTIRPTVRSLPLGDFFWVAKCNDPTFLARYGEEGDEIALDYIIERKRLDDLISSIKDGRFHEQKFRLRRSGVKNVIYLIEEISISQETRTKYTEAVQSAIASTQVVNGFFVKRTKGLDDTIRYLTRMTSFLKSTYE